MFWHRIIAYLIVFLIAGCPIIFIYHHFMQKLKQIKKDNGFTDMDIVFKGYGPKGYH